MLDRTAFYPTSGGQPFDTGRLGTTDVVNTIDDGERVLHVVSALPRGDRLNVGEAVHGEIDWTRRFDHMQQHTGQHVLSAAFDRVLDNRTMSFHMGGESATIDLAREASSVDVERCVDEANRVVWEDRPVTIRFASPEEAARLPLRKEPVREGPLRLIEVADFDLSACGGTHVARTGEIGLIAVTAAEKFRGGSRLTFVCGGRALRALRGYRDAVAGSVRSLSVLPHELPAAVERIQADGKQARKTIARLQSELAVHEAVRLIAASPRRGWRAARRARPGRLGRRRPQGSRFVHDCRVECCGGARWHVGADRARRGAVARCRARRERSAAAVAEAFRRARRRQARARAGRRPYRRSAGDRRRGSRADL